MKARKDETEVVGAVAEQWATRRQPHGIAPEGRSISGHAELPDPLLGRDTAAHPEAADDRSSNQYHEETGDAEPNGRAVAADEQDRRRQRGSQPRASAQGEDQSDPDDRGQVQGDDALAPRFGLDQLAISERGEHRQERAEHVLLAKRSERRHQRALAHRIGDRLQDRHDGDHVATGQKDAHERACLAGTGEGLHAEPEERGVQQDGEEPVVARVGAEHGDVLVVSEDGRD